MTIGILDYGVGNLFSLQRSLEHIGAASIIVKDPAQMRACSKLLLPGVGAFADARRKLKDSGLEEALLGEVAAGKPLLGVCLGMQLLMDSSEEFGFHEGLGLLPGRVASLRDALPAELKVPHIGWNALQFTEPSHPMLRHNRQGDCMYFVHSYHVVDCPHVTAWCEYGIPVAAAVAREQVWGCQFHPEKSGQAGLSLLRAFSEAAA